MPALEKAENVLLDEAVQKQIEDIEVGDSSSVVEFIRSFGSHYITSFITGNSLYQVKYSAYYIYLPSANRENSILNLLRPDDSKFGFVLTSSVKLKSRSSLRESRTSQESMSQSGVQLPM
jgi:hypothetical protein